MQASAPCPHHTCLQLAHRVFTYVQCLLLWVWGRGTKSQSPLDKFFVEGCENNDKA